MMRARRILIIVASVLLVATGALAMTHPPMHPAGSLHNVWHSFPKQWPDPPVGALMFAAVGWWVLMRRHRRSPRADFND